METVTYRKRFKSYRTVIPPLVSRIQDTCLCYAYQIFNDEDIFLSSPSTQDRMVPNDTGTNQRSIILHGIKENPFTAAIHLQLPTLP